MSDNTLDFLDDSELTATKAVKPGTKVHSYVELDSWFKVFGQARPVKSDEEAQQENADPDPGEEWKIAEELAKKVAEEEISLFVIVGPAGTGKTRRMKEVANQEKVLYIEGGKVSPLGFYCDVFPCRYYSKIILDDAESILKDTDGRNLAKGFCQTERIKRGEPGGP